MLQSFVLFIKLGGASTLAASLPRSGQTYGRSVDCEAGIWSFGAGWEADKVMLL